MIAKFCRFFLKKDVKKGDALYELVQHPRSKESRKILKRAGEMANEEQRDLYYKRTIKSGA